MSEELQDVFAPASNPEGRRLAEQLIGLFDLNAEDLKFKWEAYCLSNKNAPDFVKAFDEFKESLKQSLQRPTKKIKVMAPKSLNVSTSSPHTPAKQVRSGAGGIPKTPAHAHMEPLNSQIPTSDLPSSPVSSSFYNRVDKGKIVGTFNEGFELSNIEHKPFRSSLFSDIPKYTYHTMYQKLGDVGKTIDDQIERVKALLIEHKVVSPESFKNPCYISQEEIAAVGRIVNEDLDSPTMGATSIMLETSRRQGSGGSRVKLDVSKLKEFSFFPGQIVSVRGINANDTSFSVSEVIDLPAMPVSMPVEADTTHSGPVQMLIAAGPFTLPDNLLFEPLKDLVTVALLEKPSAVILAGPFLNSNHPMLLNGDIPGAEEAETIDDVFRALVSPILNQLDVLGIPVILVPSLGDACVKQNAFPQSPFPKSSLKLGKHCKCLPNPSTFALDQHAITVSTLDALQDLIRAATKRSGTSLPPNALAFRHILRQRRLYPVSPAPVERKGTNIDYPHLTLAEFSDVAPHILIVPSSIMHCCRLVDGVLCINPGKLTKNAAGGTYARVTFSAEALDVSKLGQQVRVDFIKI